LKRWPHSSDDHAIGASLDRLCDEVATLRQVLDESLDAIQWANQNRGDGAVYATRRITSMSLDVTAPDWSERMNRFSATGIDADDIHPAAGVQSHLF
jgi:hypothetical protein